MAKNTEKTERVFWLDDQPGEEWCFECKDGGQLVLCDHENCGKVYHPKCVGKDDFYFDTVKSWVCGKLLEVIVIWRHFCSDCNKTPKFYCLGCSHALCGKCLAVSSEFAVVRGAKGLCIDCLEIVNIVEQNLDHDLEGNKINLDDRETYECLFKEYWEIIKEKEGLSSEDISAIEPIYKKRTDFMHHKNLCKGEEEKQNDSKSWESKGTFTEFVRVKEGLTSKDIYAAQPNYQRGKKIMHNINLSEDEEEKQDDYMSSDSDEGYKPAKRKRYNLEKLVGWGSKPFIEKSAKVKEGSASEDISDAQGNYKKDKKIMHPINLSEDEEYKNDDSMSSDSDEGYKPAKRKNYSLKKLVGWGSKPSIREIAKVKEGPTSGDTSASQPNYKRGKKIMHSINLSEDEDDDFMSSDSDEGYKPAKRKRYSLEKFVGWGSKPLVSFLAFIGKDATEPFSQSSVTSLIHEYIKEKNLHDPKYKGKFLPDEKLFPIFRKKVVSKSQIYSLLTFHFAKKLDDSSVQKNDNQRKKNSSHKHVNDQSKSMKSRLSSLIGKSVLRKGEFFIKSSTFASINANNINLIYLKRSLVLELSKQPESFMDKVVGTFVRVKVDSNDSGQRKSYHLVRVVGVVFDEMSTGTLLQVSFMGKAIPISDLSDEDFTERECEDLQQKVKASLFPKLTVVEIEEKAKCLHEKIGNRLVHLQNQIEQEKEELEKPSKQEQLLRRVPSVRPELIEAKYDDSDDDK
ncbi:hypothetical protein Fmac_007111 [Flemingia macrophylla]|uniref:Uncharacterized protein n=1 Tax=Flemingia macrophylla TaxID=520843 RepID=A0ABD1ND03_9FABA